MSRAKYIVASCLVTFMLGCGSTATHPQQNDLPKIQQNVDQWNYCLETTNPQVGEPSMEAFNRCLNQSNYPGGD